MTTTGILSAIVVGAIIGPLGHLAVPGKKYIPIWLSVATGMVAAFIGNFTARLFVNTSGFSIVELIYQVVLAALGVFGVAGLFARRSIRRGRPSSSPRAPSSYPADFLEQPPLPPPARPVQTPKPPPRTTPTPRTKVFLSYRRSDTPYAARGVADQLRRQLGPGEVFMDVDSIAPGLDFIHGVQNAINGSAVMLVLIGDRWLDARDQYQRRRLDEPDDNVRCEIEQALQMRCRILPVLVDQAAMPGPQELPPSLEPLRRFNAVRVRHDSWDDDVAKLTQAVAQLRAHP